MNALALSSTLPSLPRNPFCSLCEKIANFLIFQIAIRVPSNMLLGNC